MGWVSGAAPSRRMRGPLGLRIFLMAGVFMRLSRRMRLKPLGKTPGQELDWAGEEGYRRLQEKDEWRDSRVRQALTSYVGR